MLTFVAITSAIAASISGILYGYAAVLKAKAWRTWADRCDPKGVFHPPIGSQRTRNARLP
jgi:hypothetical protein